MLITPVSFISFCMADGSRTVLILLYYGHLNNLSLKCSQGKS